MTLSDEDWRDVYDPMATDRKFNESIAEIDTCITILGNIDVTDFATVMRLLNGRRRIIVGLRDRSTP